MEPHDSVTTYGNVTLDDFCRLCLQQCGARCMRPLRGRSVNFGTDKVSIPDMLVYVCGMPSNLTDELPQRVCKTCITRLESAYLICRDFKEKETILDRFYMNGFVLQRLVQYEKFRFDSDEHENEATMEKSTEMETNENDTMQIRDVFSMNVSQSGMEEEEFSNNQMVQPTVEKSTDDCSDDQSKQSIIEIFPQSSIVSLDTDYDSDDSGGVSTESPQSYKKAKPTTRKCVKRTVATSIIPLHPEPDGLFHCVHCPRRFSQRKHYMEHLSGHRALMEERYKCPNPKCGKCFRKKDQLNRHTANCRRRTEDAA
ncbi:uncharacterized protein LOC135707011 [Ochlerotatus camptorhynchus]|uniref:uncharacterized protein LOC135707011 n=1 Tax=Ochlerotatus camptorhynchus TaxID=644619 RepID=UPI0031D91E20